jgi:hypothetical protein
MKRVYTVFLDDRPIYHGKDEECIKAFLARQRHTRVRVESDYDWRRVSEPGLNEGRSN